MSEINGPLRGVRIADFTTNMSGPHATLLLGDQGADVVKVEPPAGDVIRRLGTSTAGMSAYFANLNRSKRSLAVDLERENASAVVDRLLATADVVIMNYRPGVAEKLGLDPQDLRRRHRHLAVIVEIVGYSDEGPYAGRPAYDHVVQALAGFAAIQADRKTGEPALVKHGVVDKATGLAVAQAITAALVGRDRAEGPRHLRISMLDVAIAFLWPDGMMSHTIEDPTDPLPSIVNSFRLTPTKDGHLAFMVVTDRQWRRLLDVMAIDDEGKMSTPEDRMRNGGEFMRKVVERLSRLTTEEAVECVASAGAPAAPVVALEDLHAHPQVVANQAVERFVHPVVGAVRQANPAVRFGAERASTLRPAPRLGEHSTELLTELGLPTAEIAQLISSGVVIDGSSS